MPDEPSNPPPALTVPASRSRSWRTDSRAARIDRSASTVSSMVTSAATQELRVRWRPRDGAGCYRWRRRVRVSAPSVLGPWGPTSSRGGLSRLATYSRLAPTRRQRRGSDDDACPDTDARGWCIQPRARGRSPFPSGRPSDTLSRALALPTGRRRTRRTRRCGGCVVRCPVRGGATPVGAARHPQMPRFSR